MFYKASVPGSIMLMGEHAVLHGQPAISAAIDQFIHVNLIPRNDQTIRIESKQLGTYETSLARLNIEKPFTFVLAAILQHQSNLPSGLTLIIDSEIEFTLGLGSSAAVTVATLRCLDAWLTQADHPGRLLQRAIATIRGVQGIGSGADAAASVYEGVIFYEMNLCQVTKLPFAPLISLVYSGHKIPTVDVIQQVNRACAQHPSLYHSLFEKMGACTHSAKHCFMNQDWETVGALFHQQQQLLDALGVSSTLLNTLIDDTTHCEHILGAKISGSGLGDCIVTLGELPKDYFPTNKKQQIAGVRQLSVKLLR